MKNLTQWGLPAALLSVMAIATAPLNLRQSAIASPITPNLTRTAESSPVKAENWQLAQATESFCRRVIAPSGLIVRQGPSPNTARVSGIAFDAQVTLAQGYEAIKGPGGRLWLEIVSPVRGYVSNGYADNASNLGYCTERAGAAPVATTTATTQSLCRAVNPDRASRGLAIRESPSRFATYKGGVGAGERVTLVENYQLIDDRNGEPRDWVEITFPINGYVSAESLEYCPQG